jgi:hypothetical protein
MMTGWSVHVELHNDGAPESALDVIREHLTEHHATTGYAPGSGNVSVRMMLDATTARKALDAGIRAATDAAYAAGASTAVLGVEVMTEGEMDRRLAEPAIPKLAGLSEVGDILGVTRQRAGVLAERDGFPPIVASLRSGPVFVEEQVIAYAARRPRTPGRPRKTD